MKWESRKISEVCAVGDGAHASIKRLSKGVLYLTSKNFKPDGIDLSKVDFISLEDFNKHFKEKGNALTKPRENDLLLSIIGTLGAPYLVRNQDEFGLSSSVSILRPDLSKIWPKYLLFWIRSNEFQISINNIKSGVAQSFLSLSMIKELPVRYPSDISTQQKIASILSAYDDLIENNLKRIRLLEEAAQHLYREWFVQFRFPGWEEVEVVDGLPEGWEKVNLYEFANLKMGFPFKAEDFNEEKNGTPVIRIRDIPNHWTNTYSKSSTSDDYWVEKNDIVIGMDGFFYTDVWGGQRGYLVQRVCRIRPNDERLNGYLLEAIRGPIKYYEKTISGATVAHLGAKHLKEIEIIKPPEKFVAELEVLNHMVEQRVNLLLQNQKLKEARDILLPRLMNQTIEV
jgi:type I restriction enzyme S subunit